MEETQIRKKIIGNRLRNLRQGRSLSYVSHDLGIGVSTLCMYERGLRTPSDDTKIKIAEYYGTTVHDIFFKKETD